MKILKTLIIFLIIIFFGRFESSSQNLSSNFLSEPYFGQPMPSERITRFAPEFFKEELHATPIFSPDGKEVYWTWMNTEYKNIQFMKLVNGSWTQPADIPFGFPEGSDSPFISSDGSKFVFTHGHFSGPGKVCIAEKYEGEWMAPQILGSKVNQYEAHWQASMTDNQNLYFGSREDIYFSEYVNGQYTSAERLGSMINTGDGETCPFVAPDESYLIFSRYNPYGELYISFKQGDGSWGEAVNMKEINVGWCHELYPNVSPDGRFLMFLSGRHNGVLLPYWVDASVIDSYRK